VFIDTPDLTNRRTIELAAFQDIGAGEAGREAYYRAVGEFMVQMPAGMRAEHEVITELIETPVAERTNLLDYGVPIALLVAGRYQEQPPLELPFDLRAFWEAERRHTVRHLSEVILAVPEATLTLATGARHYMHGDDPALVIDAIRRVSFPDVTRQLQTALDREGAVAAVQRYHLLKRRFPPERFHVSLLNTYGYELLRGGRAAEAVAIFELNVAEYPDAPNPHDSLGDGYSAVGRTEEARPSYQTAVDLAEATGDGRLTTFRSNLERVERQLREQQ
jgi:tetratricopeptide (TPR) repeat protein